MWETRKIELRQELREKMVKLPDFSEKDAIFTARKALLKDLF